MLFSSVLIMLSASPRMSGFIYQVSRFHIKQIARPVMKTGFHPDAVFPLRHSELQPEEAECSDPSS